MHQKDSKEDFGLDKRVRGSKNHEGPRFGVQSGEMSVTVKDDGNGEEKKDGTLGSGEGDSVMVEAPGKGDPVMVEAPGKGDPRWSSISDAVFVFRHIAFLLLGLMLSIGTTVSFIATFMVSPRVPIDADPTKSSTLVGAYYQPLVFLLYDFSEVVGRAWSPIPGPEPNRKDSFIEGVTRVLPAVRILFLMPLFLFVSPVQVRFPSGSKVSIPLGWSDVLYALAVFLTGATNGWCLNMLLVYAQRRASLIPETLGVSAGADMVSVQMLKLKDVLGPDAEVDDGGGEGPHSGQHEDVLMKEVRVLDASVTSVPISDQARDKIIGGDQVLTVPVGHIKIGDEYVDKLRARCQEACGTLWGVLLAIGLLLGSLSVFLWNLVLPL
jgi:hypothetical protein